MFSWLKREKKIDEQNLEFTGRIHYKIIRKIADGGMGSIYKAKLCGVAGFEKIVALKTMLPQYAEQHNFVENFINEAQLVANLIHENIVQIYMFDQVNGTYFFVMEFVDGICLYDLLDFFNRIGMRMDYKLAVFTAGRIARGLAYAHGRIGGDGKKLNLVHCDICPHNIMINSEGVPKLTDFGIAKAGNHNITGGRVAGKLAFMSPEQADKQELDFRSDIYSLGVVLFFMLSGEMIRNMNGTTAEIILQARNNEIPWDKLPPCIDAELRQILHKMLATNREERYNDTAQLAKDLEYYIYKDGYGPTIVTLATYIKENMPGAFDAEADGRIGYVAEDDRTQVISENDSTLVMK